MPPKKKSSKKKTSGSSPRKESGYPAKALLAALLLSAFLVVSLILLSQFGRQWRPAPEPSPVSRQAGVEDIRVEVDSFLLRARIPLSAVQTLPEHEGAGLQVRAPFPPGESLETLKSRLKRLDAGLTVERSPLPGGEQLRVLRGGVLLYVVRFLPPQERPEEPGARRPSGPTPSQSEARTGARPRIAIIMDDLGRDLATGRALVKLGIPVTFSILPGEAYAARVAELAHQNGREVLIHIPMEPQGYPLVDPGGDALFLELAPEEIAQRMRGYLDRVPHAVGGNNHMGSRFTEDRVGMRTVLGVMREAGLFFVDSLTSARSVAYEEARRAGIPAAARDVFLDNDQEEEAISAQIRKLASLARKKGAAVGICHPYPETLAALRRQTPELERMGIEVVPISQLLAR